MIGFIHSALLPRIYTPHFFLYSSLQAAYEDFFPPLTLFISLGVAWVLKIILDFVPLSA